MFFIYLFIYCIRFLCHRNFHLQSINTLLNPVPMEWHHEIKSWIAVVWEIFFNNLLTSKLWSKIKNTAWHLFCTAQFMKPKLIRRRPVCIAIISETYYTAFFQNLVNGCLGPYTWGNFWILKQKKPFPIFHDFPFSLTWDPMGAKFQNAQLLRQMAAKRSQFSSQWSS